MSFPSFNRTTVPTVAINSSFLSDHSHPEDSNSVDRRIKICKALVEEKLAFGVEPIDASIERRTMVFNICQIYSGGSIEKSYKKIIKSKIRNGLFLNPPYPSPQRCYNQWHFHGEDAEVISWLRLAANLGYASAQYDIGRLYAKRKLTKPYPKEESIRWLCLAAKQGHEEAQCMLRVMYGLHWNLAAKDLEANQVKAQEEEEVYCSEPTSDSDEEIAKTALRLATKLGYASAQYNVGNMYANRIFTLPSPKDAMRWLSLAAKQGHKKAQHKLYSWYGIDWSLVAKEFETNQVKPESGSSNDPSRLTVGSGCEFKAREEEDSDGYFSAVDSDDDGGFVTAREEDDGFEASSAGGGDIRNDTSELMPKPEIDVSEASRAAFAITPRKIYADLLDSIKEKAGPELYLILEAFLIKVPEEKIESITPVKDGYIIKLTEQIKLWQCPQNGSEDRTTGGQVFIYGSKENFSLKIIPSPNQIEYQGISVALMGAGIHKTVDLVKMTHTYNGGKRHIKIHHSIYLMPAPTIRLESILPSAASSQLITGDPKTFIESQKNRTEVKDRFIKSFNQFFYIYKFVVECGITFSWGAKLDDSQIKTFLNFHGPLMSLIAIKSEVSNREFQEMFSNTLTNMKLPRPKFI